MILGIGAFVFGYAIFYWGLQHIPGVPGVNHNERFGLLKLLGIPDAWGFAQGAQVGFTPGGTLQAEFSNETQGQTAQNATTPNNLTGGGGGGSWIAGILSGLGAPTSPNNGNKLTAWNACEGNLTGESGLGINNPFNTTLDFGGGTSVNSAGVKSYPSISIGVQATLQTLQSPAYSAIVSNLQNDGSFSDFANAVGSSPWGTSGSCIAGTQIANV